MRCTVVIRRRGRERPCEHPAVVVYPVDGTPYGRCKRHDSLEVRRFAEQHGIVPVPA